MTHTKNIYFASDLHLGVPSHEESLKREKLFIEWLDSIYSSCSELHLLGDVFDFWFEYKRAVPKGFVRLLAKLSEFTDAGIPVYWVKGNHDLWMFGYLEEEIGVKIIDQPIVRDFNGKKFYLAHGDGLGPKQHFFKLVKRVFKSTLGQWFYARIHPNTGLWLASYFSKRSRKSHKPEEEHFMGEEKEFLLLHSKRVLESEHIDYFVYGHRHLAMEHSITEKSTYINLGDWISSFSYGVFDGKQFHLNYFNKV